MRSLMPGLIRRHPGAIRSLVIAGCTAIALFASALPASAAVTDWNYGNGADQYMRSRTYYQTTSRSNWILLDFVQASPCKKAEIAAKVGRGNVYWYDSYHDSYTYYWSGDTGMAYSTTCWEPSYLSSHINTEVRTSSRNRWRYYVDADPRYSGPDWDSVQDRRIVPSS